MLYLYICIMNAPGFYVKKNQGVFVKHYARGGNSV